jgi:hypothetical protein
MRMRRGGVGVAAWPPETYAGGGGKSSAVAVGQDDLLHHCHAGHAAHRSVHRRVARAVGIGKEAVVGGAEIGGRDENGVTIPP